MLNDPLTIETVYTEDSKIITISSVAYLTKIVVILMSFTIVTPVPSIKITTSDKWVKLYLPANRTPIESRQVLYSFFYKLYVEFNSKAALKVTYSL